jgi:diguanylate cyclase (GGDEF)-like protein
MTLRMIFSHASEAIRNALRGNHQSIERLNASLKDAEKKLRKLAFQDALTDLPNYRMFSEWIALRIQRSDLDGLPFILLFIDMDRLKLINDQYGHVKGDLLIRSLCSHLRNSLPQQSFLCRRSGDEFIVVIDLLPGQSVEDYKLLVTDQLNKVSLAIEEDLIDSSVSAGGVVYPLQAQTLKDLIICADSALDKAKATGRAKTVWYSEELGILIKRARQVQELLVKAIFHDEIKPKYQPEVDMRTGEIIGFEALARWTDPLLGPIGPNEFIKIAEENHLIEQLSSAILKKIIADSPLILTRFPKAKIAFNASPLLFRNRVLIQMLRVYRQTDPEALAHLEIEVTESDLSVSPEDVFDQLLEIQSMGINVSIDDFGKGYSSFTRLAEMPINRLKIDSGFVSGLIEPNREKIIRAIINLAHVLELEVTAEGVETAAQMKGLLDAGCYRAQGWLFSGELSVESLMQTGPYLTSSK